MGNAVENSKLVNTGQSGLPETLNIGILLSGEELGSIAVPQAEFLSDKGNVTYRGGIRKGWKLPGEAIEALSALAVTVDGIEASQHASGVHLSSPRIHRKGPKAGSPIAGTGGNPTVGFTAVVPLTAGDETKDYMVQVYATRIKDGSYNLSVKGFPQGIAPVGPQVVGEVSGLFVEQA